jgi:hypothetical protein
MENFQLMVMEPRLKLVRMGLLIKVTRSNLVFIVEVGPREMQNNDGPISVTKLLHCRSLHQGFYLRMRILNWLIGTEEC